MVCFLVSVQLKLIDFLKGSPLLETVVVSPAKTLTEPSVTWWLQTPQPSGWLCTKRCFSLTAGFCEESTYTFDVKQPIAEGREHPPSSCQGESLPHPHSSPGGSNSGGLEPCQWVGQAPLPQWGERDIVGVRIHWSLSFWALILSSYTPHPSRAHTLLTKGIKSKS